MNMSAFDIKIAENWLSQPPKYTTFRVNSLKNFNAEILKEYLILQANKLNSPKLPNFYLLMPDCLVIEQWPIEADDEKCKRKEVIVDTQCAAAVLRGAHVFAPGVIGLPSNCEYSEVINIYGDLEGHCKRGLKVCYEGKKIFVGTGVLKMLRSDLFDNGVQPRIMDPRKRGHNILLSVLAENYCCDCVSTFLK